MLTGKALLEKIDELDKLGKDDQFITLACGYENLESFDEAYSAATKSSEDLGLIKQQVKQREEVALEQIKHQEELARKEQRERQEVLIRLKEKKEKEGFIVKAKYLATVDKQLTGKYSDEEIAIACGYFKTNSSGEKIACLENYLEARSRARDQNEFAYIDTDEVNIFKGHLLLSDEDHGGTVYVPKRIVEESKDWDYSQSDLRDFNVDYFLIRNGIPENYEEDKEYLSSNEYLEDLEEAKEELDSDISWLAKAQAYSGTSAFVEPMMAIEVTNQIFVDQTLKPNWDVGWGHEYTAEFYGLRYEDCHPGSRFCDG